MSLSKKDCPDVSIIIPIYNGEEWIDECFDSILYQTAKDFLTLEVSVFNDASSDNTESKLEVWQAECDKNNIILTKARNDTNTPAGVGYAKNKAVGNSRGKFLCFLDIDDIMEPDRIACQYNAAKDQPYTLVGSQFRRTPEGSTRRFTHWANTLIHEQLYHQIYTSHGPTLIMPTWFCPRQVFTRVGGFSERGKGTPEDLIFFYKHLDMGGNLHRVDKCLLNYRYHFKATTFSISEESIWEIRLKRLQEKVLSKWSNFTIWNAGRIGRKLFRSLEPEFQSKVQAFCDVDKKKIGKFYVPYNRGLPCKREIPMVHFTEAKSPIVICVKLGLTGGSFEENLNSLNLIEGRDFIHF